MSYLSLFEQELEELRQKDLYRRLKILEGRDATRVFYENRELLLFCGNDYLGLSHDSRLVSAMKAAADTYGVGSGAARLISGTTRHHARLEEKTAAFKGKENALIYTAGYLANLGVLSALAGEKDLIVMDKLCHASLIDGARLSGAQVRVFPHKNYERAGEILKQAEKFEKKLLVSDTVFSMDGDQADIPELVRLKKQYGCLLILDDAHGTGVLGKKGTGAAEGFEKDMDVITGTFSKAVGVIGGFAATSNFLREVLINKSRSFIFATSLPPALCAAAAEGLSVLEKDSSLRAKLRENMETLQKELSGLMEPASFPIFPVIIGPENEAVRISEVLLNQGFLVPAVRTPAVPKGKARLRITLSAVHDAEQIRKLAAALKPLLRQLEKTSAHPAQGL